MTEDFNLYQRQSGIVNMEALKNTKVTLVGAGGIGSTAALMLAKMGCRDITVYDFDHVEDHNLPNQMYPPDTLGLSKVEALKETVRYMTGEEIKVVEDRFDGTEFDGGVLILAVDSMAAREAIYRNVKNNVDLELLIDGRMGGWLYTMYTLDPTNPQDFEDYEENLFTDEEAAPVPCTEKAVIFNTASIGGEIAKAVARYANRDERSFEVIRDLKLDLLFK